MNGLLWLWDVLVVERRLTQFPDAVNAAFECGRQQGRKEGYVDALEDRAAAVELAVTGSHHSKEA